MNKLTKVFALLLVVALASTTFYVGTQFSSSVHQLGDEQNVTPVDLESSLEFDPLHVSIEGESKLHVNESSTYQAVVSGGSGNFGYVWSVDPLDGKTVFVPDGDICSFMFVVATIDPYTLSVEVTDLVSGDKAFDSFTVYDPYTLPDLYLEASLADFVCRVKSDGAGWYFVSDGESGKTLFSSTVLFDATDYALTSTTSGNVLLDGVYFDYSLDIPVGVSVTESVDGLTRVFVNEADRQGSPYTVSVDSVHPTYYLVQDCMGRFIDDYSSSDCSSVINSTQYALPQTSDSMYYGKIAFDSGKNFTCNTLIYVPQFSSIIYDLQGSILYFTGTSNTNVTLGAFNYISDNQVMDAASYGTGQYVRSIPQSLSIINGKIDTSSEEYLSGILVQRNALTNFQNLQLTGYYNNITTATFSNQITGLKYYSAYNNIQNSIDNVLVEGYYYGVRLNGDHYVSNGLNVVTNHIGLAVDRAFHSTFNNYHAYLANWAGIYFFSTSQYQDCTFVNPSVEGTVTDTASNGEFMTDDGYAGQGVSFVDCRVVTDTDFVGNFTGFTFTGNGFKTEKQSYNTTANTWVFPLSSKDLAGVPTNIMATFPSATSEISYTWSANSTYITVTALTALNDAQLRCSIIASFNPSLSRVLYEYNIPTVTGGISFTNGYWKAQVFTTNSYTHSVNEIRLQMYRVGSATPGTITVSIRATVDGLPTGADLTSGTIVGTLLTTVTYPGVWYSIPVTEINLDPDTQYAIVVRTSITDYTNSPYWSRSTSTNYVGGNCTESDDFGSTWSVTSTTADYCFEVFGD